MGIVTKLTAAIRGTESDEGREEPSHRCQSCGEEYFTDPAVEIDTCRGCGGVKVEAVA